MMMTKRHYKHINTRTGQTHTHGVTITQCASAGDDGNADGPAGGLTTDQQKRKKRVLCNIHTRIYNEDGKVAGVAFSNVQREWMAGMAAGLFCV